MKSVVAISLVIAAVLTGSPLHARTLVDMLKEKGAITEEEYQELRNNDTVPATAAAQPAVAKEAAFKTEFKQGKGIVFTSADEKFSSSIMAILQLRYSFLDNDDSNNSAVKKAQDVSRFELRRIKLCFNGYAYTKDLSYQLVINFANSQNPAPTYGLLEYTWMNYRFLDELQVRFGQDKVPFGRQFLNPSSAQQLVDRSTVTTAFIPGIDTGLMIHGKIAGGLFNYNIAGYGGLGQNTFRSTSSDNAFSARININPLGDMPYSESDFENSAKPLVSLGANFFRDTLNGTESNNIMFAGSKGWYGIGNSLQPAPRKMSISEAVDFNTAGFDTAFKWRGASLQGEYFLAQADGQTTGNKLRAHGGYIQAGYFIIPQKLELAARYSYFDPNRDVTNDQWVETTGGVSYYFNKHYLKLQADYTNIHKQKGLALNSGPNNTDDHLARFQAQIIF